MIPERQVCGQKEAKCALTFDGEVGGGGLLPEDSLDFAGVLQFGHIDGHAVLELLLKDLVLGSRHYLDVVDVPVNRDLLVADLDLKDGVVILLDMLVLQTLGDRELQCNRHVAQLAIYHA